PASRAGTLRRRARRDPTRARGRLRHRLRRKRGPPVPHRWNSAVRRLRPRGQRRGFVAYDGGQASADVLGPPGSRPCVSLCAGVANFGLKRCARIIESLVSWSRGPLRVCRAGAILPVLNRSLTRRAYAREKAKECARSAETHVASPEKGHDAPP